MYFYMKYYYLFFHSVWYTFFQGTSVSITFYLFEHYQLWMIDSNAQWVLLWCPNLLYISTVSPKIPKWGVLANRLK